MTDAFDAHFVYGSSRRSAARSWPRPALAQEAPDALVKRVSQEVLAIIKSDPKVQAGDQARIREVVETKLLPYFDFERITALAMGRNWRQATPEQQKQLVDQFRALLVRTYSGALTQYRDQTMDYKPLRARRERDGRHRAHRSHPPGPGAGADRLLHGQDARRAGRSTTSSSAACRSSPTTATSSTSRSRTAASTA